MMTVISVWFIVLIKLYLASLVHVLYISFKYVFDILNNGGYVWYESCDLGYLVRGKYTVYIETYRMCIVGS